MLFTGSSMFNAQMYSHAIASMALCEAYGLSKDPRLKEPAQLAINFIAMSQNKYDGGWRYTPASPGASPLNDGRTGVGPINTVGVLTVASSVPDGRVAPRPVQ